MLNKLARGLLYFAGMVGGATAGNLFYMERYPAGCAIMALTGMCLFFAMAELNYRGKNDGELEEELAKQRKMLSSLGILLAGYAVDGYKHIGRTMPGIPAELNKLEDELVPLLSSLGISRAERDRVLQDIEKLRTRSRHNEGRRALTGGAGR